MVSPPKEWLEPHIHLLNTWHFLWNACVQGFRCDFETNNVQHKYAQSLLNKQLISRTWHYGRKMENQCIILSRINGRHLYVMSAGSAFHRPLTLYLSSTLHWTGICVLVTYSIHNYPIPQCLWTQLGTSIPLVIVTEISLSCITEIQREPT